MRGGYVVCSFPARVEEGVGGGDEAAPGTGSEAGAVAGREPSRLCGYLQKLSGKGPLRGYRSRWFVFDSRRCYLYYFKSPQDALPLGHLDIADACFSYQGREEAAEPGADPPTHFQVHSAGAVTVLKVGSSRPGAHSCPASSRFPPSTFLPFPNGLLLSCPSLPSYLHTQIPSSFLSFALYLCLSFEAGARLGVFLTFDTLTHYLPLSLSLVSSRVHPPRPVDALGVPPPPRAVTGFHPSTSFTPAFTTLSVTLGNPFVLQLPAL